MQDNIISIKFSDSKVPEFKEVRNSDYVRFGEDDNYADYLIYLLNKSAKHNSIVNSKTTYIYGGGLKTEVPEPAVDAFIKRYDSLIKKVIFNTEAFGGGYLQAIPTRDGTGFGFYDVSFQRIRTNRDASEFYYKKDWNKRQGDRTTLPAFDSTVKVPSILMYKQYRVGDNLYPLPGFIAACNYIEADIEVSKHTLTNAQTGFSASKFINFYNGEPDETIKRSIEERFVTKFGGSQGAKMIIGFNMDPAKKPTIDDLGASDMTKEDFSQTDQLISSNIYAGHSITNAALFGVPAQNHSLGGNAGAELKISYDIFKNTYVAEKKKDAESLINMIASLNGITSLLTLIDIEPVGYSFSEATLLQIAPRSWLLEKLGIDITKYTDAPALGDAGGAVVPVQQEAVNEHLKNLTAKQHQQLQRIIREHTKGKMTRAMAALLLKSSLGFTDEDVNVALGSDQTFSADDDVAMLFEAHGESKTNFNVFEKRKATFKGEYEDVQDSIKNYIEKHPKATPATIAKSLNVDVAVVENYLSGVSGGAAGTVSKLPKFEVRYSYEKRPEVSGPEVLATTRPFCRKLLALDRLYTRKDIQNISQYLGYDVMKRAGGFWNNDGETEYHCRHEFYSQIVIKK